MSSRTTTLLSVTTCKSYQQCEYKGGEKISVSVESRTPETAVVAIIQSHISQEKAAQKIKTNW